MVHIDFYTKDGRAMADVRGIDQPPAFVHQLLINGRLVLKVPGGSYWASRGERGYSGAEFQVYQIRRVEDSAVRSERLYEIPIRHSVSPETVELMLRSLAAQQPSPTL